MRPRRHSPQQPNGTLSGPREILRGRAAFPRALAIDEAALGSTHPNVGRDLSNLAQIYQAQGKYAEAEPLFRRALTIAETALGQTHRTFARRLGLGLAMLARLGLLFSISWVMGLTQPWFALLGNQISGRDLILIGGGLFLLAKATHEIHYSLEGIGEKETAVLGSSLGMARR